MSSRIDDTRDVLLYREGEEVHCRLRIEHFDDGTYKLHAKSRIGTFVESGYDLFDTLVKIRRAIEPQGWRILVNGARKDAWPSGMLRDQMAGAAVYVLSEDPKEEPSRVGTFDPAPEELVVTVDEQETAFRAWARRRRQ